MRKSALILFAHGARDPRWTEPFQGILARVQAGAPERAPMLAFLELMTPDLASAVATQVQRGFTAIRIVPLFLGPGGHVRDDLPRLVQAMRERHPDVQIDLAAPAGEEPAIIAALANYCLSI